MKKISFILFALILIIAIPTYFQYNSSSKPVIVSKKSNSLQDEKLKIMTYNIHRGVNINGDLELEQIANTIKKADPDIVGLNEVDYKMPRTKFQNQIKILADKLGMNYVYGPNIKVGISGYGNAMLSKYPIKDSQNHRLPQKSLTNEPRGLLDNTIILPTNKKLHVMVTHLTTNSEERKNQLVWIKDYSSNLKHPFILMGDFNTELSSFMGLKPLSGQIKTYPTANPHKGIDLIFSNYKFDLINENTVASNSSDHLPLYVEVRYS